MNVTIFFSHILIVGGLTLCFLRVGKEAMIAYLSLLGIAANLFVHKQISLFGLEVTCSDALAVGYLLGCNLIQEFFGAKAARTAIFVSLYLNATFLLFSLLHLAYAPSPHDTTHAAFTLLLSPLPRITLASLFCFAIAQFFELHFFGYLKKKSEGRHLLLRVATVSLLSYTLDTVLFSFLGLYGIVAHLSHVMLFSVVIKLVALLLFMPTVFWARKIVRAHAV